MKKIQRLNRRIIAGGMVILCLLWSVFGFLTAAEEKQEEIQGLYAVGAVLMDADSGRVLYEKNGKEILPMASTTKIMTCILALERADPDMVVTFSDYAASMPDVQLNARAGENFYLRDLLYSMMLESHNDSSVAVAEAVAGSVESFAALMNEKAKELECVRTHFVTPNGLDGEDAEGIHATCAEDLARVLKYCIKDSSKKDQFLEITRTPSYTFSNTEGSRSYSCSNHNALLTSFEGAISGKTGFTSKAGYCYVGAVQGEHLTMVAALLGSGWYPHKSYKWSDVRKLFAYGNKYYRVKTIGSSDWELLPIPVTDGMQEEVRIFTDARELVFPVKEGERIRVVKTCEKTLEAPAPKGTKVGEISYYLNEELLETFPICTGEKTEKATFCKKLKNFLKGIPDFVKIRLKK